MTEKPMTSDRRVAANRRNAQRSTGPKSESGKRVSALNAIRHGLTSSANVFSHTPEFSELQALIQEEINDPSASRLIAEKILDYERAESYNLKLAQREAAGVEDSNHQAAAAAFKAENSLEGFLGEGAAKDFLELLVTEGDLDGLKIHARIMLLIEKNAIRRERHLAKSARLESISLRRHYKRANNQLIKAIKSASVPK